jgi:hypothetical protein
VDILLVIKASEQGLAANGHRFSGFIVYFSARAPFVLPVQSGQKRFAAVSWVVIPLRMVTHRFLIASAAFLPSGQQASPLDLLAGRQSVRCSRRSDSKNN